jgi:hypothetical protein
MRKYFNGILDERGLTGFLESYDTSYFSGCLLVPFSSFCHMHLLSFRELLHLCRRTCHHSWRKKWAAGQRCMCQCPWLQPGGSCHCRVLLLLQRWCPWRIDIKGALSHPFACMYTRLATLGGCCIVETLSSTYHVGWPEL